MLFKVWRMGRIDHHSRMGAGIFYIGGRVYGLGHTGKYFIGEAYGQLAVYNEVWLVNPFWWAGNQITLLFDYFNCPEIAAKAIDAQRVIHKNLTPGNYRSDSAYAVYHEIDSYIARNMKRMGYDGVVYYGDWRKDFFVLQVI